MIDFYNCLTLSVLAVFMCRRISEISGTTMRVHGTIIVIIVCQARQPAARHGPITLLHSIRSGCSLYFGVTFLLSFYHSTVQNKCESTHYNYLH